jgi:U3 small nucleolar RNA-associated protein 11
MGNSRKTQGISFTLQLLKIFIIYFMALTKKKDYSLRAKDYNLKKQKLGRLREKAQDRNPDEFAYGMLSDQNARQGRHGARDTEASSLSHDTVKLLKTQDAGYLRTVGERVRREVERLEKEVQLQDGMAQVLGEEKTTRRGQEDEDDEDLDDLLAGAAKRRKIIFAESQEDQKKLGGLLDDSEDEEMSDDDEEDDSFGKRQQQQENKTKQPSKKQLEAERLALSQKRAARKLKRRAAEGRVRKLAALKKQYAEISTAERQLELQRARMTNSIGGVNKNGVKWKVKERKR